MTDVTSTLSVKIETGQAARDLLALQKGLDGAAQGVARLGREIQNHSGNIQRVLGELSKYGFSGLSQSITNETGKVGASMRQLEKEVEQAAARSGKRAGKSMAKGMVDEAVDGSANLHKIMLRSAEMTGKYQLAEAARLTREKISLAKTALKQEAADQKAADAEKLRSQKLYHKIAVGDLKERLAEEKAARSSAVAVARTFETSLARSSGIRGQVSALTVNPAAEAGLKDYYLMLERVSRTVEQVRVRQEAWAATSSARVSQAVGGLVSENAELSKMRAHYAAIQRVEAQARASSFQSFGLSASKGNLQAAIAARTGAGMGASTMSLEYAEGRSALGDIEKASIAASNTAQALGRVSPAVGRSREAMKRWSQEAKIVHDTARGAAAGVGYLWMTWGNIGAMATGFTAIRAVSAGIKEMVDMEKQLTFAAQAGGGTVENLQKRIMAMYGGGQRMLHTSGQLAEALKTLTLAGFSTDEAFQMLTHTYKFAAAGELDLADAAQGIQQTMNSFRLPMSETGRVTDVLAKAAAASAVTIDDMVQAMKTGSVIGALYNVSVEDFARSAALLGKVGIYGQAAGTAIKNFYTELSSPKSKKADEAMKQWGLSFYDAGNKLKPLNGIIEELREKFSSLSGTNQQAFFSALNNIFNERGIKEAAQLIKMTDTEWKKLNDTMAESKGFVDRMYDALSGTTQGIFEDLKSQGMASLTEALKEADPAIKALGESLRTLVTSSGFKEFLSSTVALLAQVTALLAEHGRAILGVIAAYAGFKVAAGTLHLVVGGLGRLAAAYAAVRTAAAVGAMGTYAQTLGAVGRGAATTMTGLTGLRGVLALIPGPLGVIGGLLTAGAALWAIWGNSAKSAADTAATQMETTASRAAEVLARIRREAKFGTGDLGVLRERYQELRRSRDSDQSAYDKAIKEGRHADAIPLIDKIANANAEISDMRPDVQRLATEERRLNAPQAAGSVTIPDTGNDGKRKKTSPLSVADYQAEIKLYRTHLHEIDRLEREQLTRSKAAFDAGLSTEKAYLSERNAARAAADESAKGQLDAYVVAQNGAADDALAEYMKQFKEASAKGLLEDEATVNKFDTLVNRMSEAYAKIQQAQEQYANRSGERDRAEALDQLAQMREKYGNPDEDIRNAREKVDALRAENDAIRGLTEVNRDKNLVSIEGSIRSVEGLVNEAWATAEVTNLTWEQVTALEGKLDALRSLKSEYEKHRIEQEAIKNNALLGAKRGMRDYLKDTEEVGTAMRRSVSDAFKGMEDALTEFVKTGKLDFRSLANSIIADIARVQARQWVGAAVQGLNSLIFSAQGNVFPGGTGLSAYRNTVVDRPTMFAFARGAGIMGEEPGSPGEAIMPLTRMSGGDLGVKVSGGGGGGGDVNTTIQINIESDGKTTVSRDGASKLGQQIEAEVMRVIFREKRQGGVLSEVA